MKSLFIGFVHGLAGSAAMVLLTMSTVDSVWQGGLYILVFGVGTYWYVTIYNDYWYSICTEHETFTLSRILIMITGR